MSQKSDNKKQTHTRTGLMWAVAGAGGLLVALTVGFFLYQALTRDDGPAELVIATGEVVATAGGFLLPVEVSNHGREVAAGLLVEGTLLAGETAVESSSLTFDYVPVGSARRGRLLFRADPRQYELEVQARGYALP